MHALFYYAYEFKSTYNVLCSRLNEQYSHFRKKTQTNKVNEIHRHVSVLHLHNNYIHHANCIIFP